MRGAAGAFTRRMRWGRRAGPLLTGVLLVASCGSGGPESASAKGTTSTTDIAAAASESTTSSTSAPGGSPTTAPPAQQPPTSPPAPFTLDLVSLGAFFSLESDPTETAYGRPGGDGRTVTAFAHAGPGNDEVASAYAAIQFEHDSAVLFDDMPESVDAVTVGVEFSLAAQGQLDSGFDRTTMASIKVEAWVDENHVQDVPMSHRVTSEHINPTNIGFDDVVDLQLTVTRQDVAGGAPLTVVVGLSCRAESGSHQSGVISTGGTCDFETNGQLTVRALTATVSPVI